MTIEVLAELSLVKEKLRDIKTIVDICESRSEKPGLDVVGDMLQRERMIQAYWDIKEVIDTLPDDYCATCTNKAG